MPDIFTVFLNKDDDDDDDNPDREIPTLFYNWRLTNVPLLYGASPYRPLKVVPPGYITSWQSSYFRLGYIIKWPPANQ